MASDIGEMVLSIETPNGYILKTHEKEFADIVSDRREVIKGGGHQNAETGYTKFNELLKYL